MLFNSYMFIFLFFPAIVFAWLVLRGKKNLRLILLLFASYVFYAWWDYRFTILLLYITLINYIAGEMIFRTQRQSSRKRVLFIAIVLNLIPLIFFKYLPWLGSYFTVFLGKESQEQYRAFLSSIILPVGISFFTFQALTYTIGIFYNHFSRSSSFLKLAVFVSSFAQIMSGPIARYKDLDGQLEHVGEIDSHIDIRGGLELFFIGLIKKMLIADRLGIYINPIFQNNADLNIIVAWAAMLGYTLQIYFDFSGYSDMAIGIGRCMGFKLPDNFLSPYTSINPSEFWRRWHVSLSSWLRDYIYIPLGGSRIKPFMTYLNLMITMFVAGIWHGANWTFVCWGLWHGILLSIHRLAPSNLKKNIPRWLSIILLNIVVIIGWVFFRVSTINQAFAFLRVMSGFGQSTSATIAWPIFFMIPIGYAIHFLERRMSDNPVQIRSRYAIIIAAAAAWAILDMGKDTPFIYFQF